jgi:aspartyl-tRNA(Asn)/glutamyl-tRNA(Gln) amidotransferase subunit C
MPLSREEVIHIAELARLGLSEAEVEQFQGQLSAILDYAAVLQRLDTEAIAPTTQVGELKNVMRPDVEGLPLPVEDVLANAPARQDDYFCVPPVIEEAP